MFATPSHQVLAVLFCFVLSIVVATAIIPAWETPPVAAAAFWGIFALELVRDAARWPRFRRARSCAENMVAHPDG